MHKKHTIYLIDFLDVLNIIGTILGVISLIPLLFFLISHIIKHFNINNFLYILLLIVTLAVVIYALFLFRKIYNNESIEKITITTNGLIIIYIKNNIRQKFILNKSDITRFHVDFDASMFGSFGSKYRSINYSMNVSINTFSGKSFNCLYAFQTKGIIKSIFRISKYIPNFSYSIDSNCIPVIEKSINKIFKTGHDLNLIEFLKYMLTNPKVSICGKIETYFWLVVIPLMLIMIFLWILNWQDIGKTALLSAICFGKIIMPLTIIMLIFSIIYKNK